MFKYDQIIIAAFSIFFIYSIICYVKIFNIKLRNNNPVSRDYTFLAKGGSFECYTNYKDKDKVLKIHNEYNNITLTEYIIQNIRLKRDMMNVKYIYDNQHIDLFKKYFAKIYEIDERDCTYTQEFIKEPFKIDYTEKYKHQFEDLNNELKKNNLFLFDIKPGNIKIKDDHIKIIDPNFLKYDLCVKIFYLPIKKIYNNYVFKTKDVSPYSNIEIYND